MQKTNRYKLIICVTGTIALLATERASAQTYQRVSEKQIRPVKSKTLILRGAVRDGEEVVYRFKALGGQRFIIRLVGRNADFSLFLNYGLDVEQIAEDTRSWSGTMPVEFEGSCEIAVHSSYKLASYQLEVLLK